jgi:hypothetical protein
LLRLFLFPAVLGRSLQGCSEHGSPRLRKALDLGLLDESNAVYRDERLEKEFPGWRWETGDDEFQDIRNPSLKALEALETARMTIGEVYLYWLPSERPDKVAVLTSQILGKAAIFPVS